MRQSGLAIVFDWDDVVFDTAKFKLKLAQKFAKQGIPRAVTLETVGIAKDGHGYNPTIHARMLAARSGSSARQGASARSIEKEIWSSCRDLAAKLLFKDAVAAIRAARRAGIPLYVLSAGRRKFQHARIYGSNLTKFFKKIYIVDVTSFDAAVATKVKVLEKIAKQHEQLVFLDDRPKTIAGVQEAKKLRGQVLPVLVWRHKTKPPNGLQVIRKASWQEIRKIAIHNGFGSY